MNEVSFAAPEIAASRQRGTPADEGKLWETLRLDAERAAAGEEMLSGFLDLAVIWLPYVTGRCRRTFTPRQSAVSPPLASRRRPCRELRR
jgi:hypothetical protein